jgi:hypothetical protein
MSRTTDISITRKADADLSARQYRFVTATASNGCALAGANARALGVLQNKPKSGEAAAIQTEGQTKVVAGGAFAVGDYVKSDANGKAVQVTGEAAGTIVELLGIALEAAAADGDIVEIQLIHGTLNRAAT